MEAIRDTLASKNSTFVSGRSFPADGGAYQGWGSTREAEPACEQGASSYLTVARASDRHFDLLSQVSGSHPCHGPEEMPDIVRNHDVCHHLDRAMGKPVHDECALKNWKERRKHQLENVANRKRHQTLQLRQYNKQMAGYHNNSTRSLADFTRSSGKADSNPSYYQHSMRNLIRDCDSYSGLVGKQIALVRQMRGMNKGLEKAGGARPHDAQPFGAEPFIDGVAGPQSADVEQPDAERLIGSQELQTTRVELQAAIDAMQQSVDAMKSGLRNPREGGGQVQHNGAGHRSGLDSEESSVGRLNSSLMALRRAHDELGFVG